MANLSTNLDYFVVDVFTETPLAGNPLAVVMNTCGLTTEQMQAIAREFNLSETTFIERRSAEVERAEGVRVRIFTTQEELPFAGHPTLGTASVLKMHGAGDSAGDTVTLALKVGPVPVRFTPGSRRCNSDLWRDDAERAGVWRGTGRGGSGSAPGSGPRRPGPGAAAASGFYRSAVCDCGAADRRGVGAAQSESGCGHGVAARARSEMVLRPRAGLSTKTKSGTKYRARMQFYGGEDPATGSAAGCAISYLVARGAAPSGTRVHVRQGVEIGRPSDLLSLRKKRFREGDGCARGGQHCSCGKRTAFPAVMHMLSTEIHLRKLQRVLALAIFRLFHMDFHSNLRLPFPLSTNLRTRTFDSLRTFPWRVFGSFWARQNAEHSTAKEG